MNVPLVIRMATGAGRQLAAQHSHSLEGWYAHIPGLRIITPATLEDARNMLAAALQCPDPVLIFEHIGLYNMEGPAAAVVPVDLDHAALRRPGRDVVLLTYGAGVHRCLEAAGELAREGIEAEVLDLRTLRPLDEQAIVESVSKTHRCIIVDEDWPYCGMGAGIMERVYALAFDQLDAPVKRVCSEGTPSPYNHHLEMAMQPTVGKVVAAAKEVCYR
jgi:pyruvate/2-oxoglutarate/acetoin dehydrogenase E1 component